MPGLVNELSACMACHNVSAGTYGPMTWAMIEGGIQGLREGKAARGTGEGAR